MNTADSSAAALELHWFKSSYSGAEGGDCVEIAAAVEGIHIRDSKVRSGPVLTVAPDAWAGLVRLAADQTI
ncbi:DUF397 domain-containing protein [Streptomyces cellostaticus]|uniref:DUF397 domain-containing protein n=1 Tax=Streptomyces cellostaticus TaxID=67285 RepID=UPI00202699D8|nr:DUF397 domain-containing protein [Streptomyces cellostaticus]